LPSGRVRRRRLRPVTGGSKRAAGARPIVLDAQNAPPPTLGGHHDSRALLDARLAFFSSARRRDIPRTSRIWQLADQAARGRACRQA